MALDHDAQGLGRNHFDLVAPLIQVPCHFEPTRRVEPHDQAAVVLRFQNLPRMKAKTGGAFGGLGGKAPDDSAELCRILPDTKGLRGVIRDGEAVRGSVRFPQEACQVITCRDV